MVMSDHMGEVWLLSRCFPKAVRCLWLSHFEKKASLNFILAWMSRGHHVESRWSRIRKGVVLW
jgi:hypothetical protein